MSAAQDFANLRLKLECSEIALTKEAEPSVCVLGPGEIWQTQEGVLQYKIFAKSDAFLSLSQYVARSRKAGQLIPDEDYFSLRAQTHSGPSWTAQRILPGFRGGIVDGFACGHLHELTGIEHAPLSPETAYVTLRFHGKLEFPCNQGTETVIRVGGRERQTSMTLNAAFVDDEDLAFEVYHEGEHTIVQLRLPSQQLTAATPERIREALQFALGKQLSLLVVETCAAEQRVTRLVSRTQGNGQMLPPLRFHKVNVDGNVWRIFISYFRHVHLNTEVGRHPISLHVGSAIESTAASLEVEVLALAVAVEGLAGDCFPHLAPVEDEFLAQLDNVATAVKGVALTERTRHRIFGAINSMRSPRNADILRSFIAHNHLPAGLFKSWSRLRHNSAHGGGTRGHDIETILRRKYDVLSLLYSLVFASINYVGRRTDYSLPNWPMRPWPVPPELSAKPLES